MAAEPLLRVVDGFRSPGCVADAAADHIPDFLGPLALYAREDNEVLFGPGRMEAERRNPGAALEGALADIDVLHA